MNPLIKTTEVVINKDRENSILDLKSLLDEKVQLELSISIANFFTKYDLDDICNTILSMNTTKKRNINKRISIIFTYTKMTGESIDILDYLYIDTAIRYIEVVTRLSSGAIYNRFRYFYNIDCYNILNKIFTDSYNFATYCGIGLTKYTVNKKFLYINFAKEAKTILGNNYTVIVDFKYIINTLLEHKLFTNKDRFIKIFNISHTIQLEILTITNNIIRLTINNKSERIYIYLDRHLKGLAQLRLLFELIIKELYP